jgi:SAM-dependent methyltransferase
MTSFLSIVPPSGEPTVVAGPAGSNYQGQGIRDRRGICIAPLFDVLCTAKTTRISSPLSRHLGTFYSARGRRAEGQLRQWKLSRLCSNRSFVIINRSASDADIQRRYYARTATKYNALHVRDDDENYLALCLMVAAVDFLGIKSILDVGSGTGRTISHIKKVRPGLLVKGIEPVTELREIAYSNGITKEELVDGDALALEFKDGAFDLVCEFAALHHIKTPARAVAEMLRVGKKAIFISDSNNFGQGSAVARTLKQLINLLGLWPLVDLIKTQGRGYTITEDDGLGYSYSAFNNYAQIRAQCASVHILNTSDSGINPYRSASHVAVLGVKKFVR